MNLESKQIITFRESDFRKMVKEFNKIDFLQEWNGSYSIFSAYNNNSLIQIEVKKDYQFTSGYEKIILT